MSNRVKNILLGLAWLALFAAFGLLGAVTGKGGS